jgi:hypothetical protein
MHSLGRPFLVVMVGAVGLLSRPATGQSINCQLTRTSDNVYAGHCARRDTTVLLLLLNQATAKASERWIGTQARIFGSGGDTLDVVDWSTFGPVFLTGGADSTFSWCWCHVTRLAADTTGLFFDVDVSRVGRATRNDVEILRRVLEDFGKPERWNRHSDRERAISYCPRTAPSKTLFCAMYSASVTVLGDYYPSPAVRAIQAAIRHTAPRRYRHPLDGFNNDPEVNFAALRQMLEMALQDVQGQLASMRGESNER